MIRIEGGIDEHDLIEKVENRLPSKFRKTPIPEPFLISQPVETENEIVIRPVNEADR